MQTETAYPQWHMSFLALKISIKDKWSVMSLNLSFITTGSKTQLQIDCLTNNLLVLHTNVRIPIFMTLIFMIFVSICLIYIYVYFTRKLERNKQLHRLKNTYQPPVLWGLVFSNGSKDGWLKNKGEKNLQHKPTVTANITH